MNRVYHLEGCPATVASKMFLELQGLNDKVTYMLVDDVPELRELDLPLFVPDKSSGIDGWSGYNPEKLKEFSEWLS